MLTITLSGPDDCEPEPPEPAAEQQLAATLADMQREIAELKARVA